jgi:uncharacterized protein (TIGR02186 family)
MLAVVVIAVTALGPQAMPQAVESPPLKGADPAPAGNGVATFAVEPRRVPIDLFYGGSTIRVTADLPADRFYAVLLEGQREPLTVKRKGKVWGLLWMNVGEVDFAEVPTVYLLRTSAPGNTLANTGRLPEDELGYASLTRLAGADTAVFRELVRLKEKEGFFSIKPGAVSLEPTGEGTAHLSTSLPLSARIPEGDYTVSLVGFDGGRARRLGQTTVHLEQVGLALALHSLAMERGLLYGCTAVIIAMLAGLGTGLIFGKGTSKGH